MFGLSMVDEPGGKRNGDFENADSVFERCSEHHLACHIGRIAALKDGLTAVFFGTSGAAQNWMAS